MTGHVVVGDHAYPNSWVEPGKTIRLVYCPYCADTGRLPGGRVCTCTRSWAPPEHRLRP